MSMIWFWNRETQFTDIITCPIRKLINVYVELLVFTRIAGTS